MRCDGVTPSGVSGVRFTFFFFGLSSVAGDVVPDGPAPPQELGGLFMYFSMLSRSFSDVASMIASMDFFFHAAAFAGDILPRRLRVMRSTISASPGSAGCSTLRVDDAQKIERGFRREAVEELGSMMRDERVECARVLPAGARDLCRGQIFR